MQNISGNFRVGVFVSAFFYVFFGIGGLSVRTLAAPGDLDPTFGGGDGMVVSDVGTEDRAYAMILQPDGKIVVAGRSREGRSFPDYELVRYNPDGSFDTTFGTGGKVRTFVPTLAIWGEFWALALQPDGKIIAVGSVRSSSGALAATAVFRYHTNGSLDTTFGAGSGYVRIEHGVDRAVVLQPDEKIVCAGGGGDSFSSNFQISRLNADGSPDNAFDGDGHVAIDFAGSGDGAYDLALQPDGKIIAAGRSRTSPADGTSDNYALTRILPNGSLDTTFDGDGKVTTDFNNLQDIGFAVVLQADGKIIVSGQASPEINNYDFGLVRYNTDGSLDTTFDGDGKVLTNIGGYDISYDLKLQRNGKIVAGGLNLEGGGAAAAITRYNPDGSLDTSFNSDGKVAFFFYANDDIRALAIQPDGKILAAGTANGGEIIGKFAVARFLGDPVTNFSSAFDFDGDLKTDISIIRPSNGEWWLNRSSTGQTVAAQFGVSTDKPTPADFTGDGKADIAFFRPSSGEWFILRSEDASFLSFPFGTNGDIPVVGDFDADGKADPTVFRPSNSTWYILKSTGGTAITTFGASGDVPVPADFDGDGKSDVAIFRPSDGSWWYIRSTDNQFRVFTFGVSTDKPVAGDYTGDGKADLAIFRPSTGEWFFQRSEDNSYYSVPFGANGDIPTPGDYDGDGKFDTAVFRPSTTTWYINRSTAGLLITNFGASGDQPIPGIFVP